MGREVNVALRCSKTWTTAKFHCRILGAFFSRAVRDDAIMLNPLMNLLWKFANPMKRCSSLIVCGAGQFAIAVTFS